MQKKERRVVDFPVMIIPEDGDVELSAETGTNITLKQGGGRFCNGFDESGGGESREGEYFTIGT